MTHLTLTAAGGFAMTCAALPFTALSHFEEQQTFTVRICKCIVLFLQFMIWTADLELFYQGYVQHAILRSRATAPFSLAIGIVAQLLVNSRPITPARMLRFACEAVWVVNLGLLAGLLVVSDGVAIRVASGTGKRHQFSRQSERCFGPYQVAHGHHAERCTGWTML